MAAAPSTYEAATGVGLGLNLARDTDISHLSLRSDQCTTDTQRSASGCPVVNLPHRPLAQFQATVDDGDDSDSDTITYPVSKKALDTSSPHPYSHKSNARDTHLPASSPPSRTPSTVPDKHPNTSAYIPHLPSAGAYVTPQMALTPPSSAESSPKQRPTVHFSTRPPVVLHHRSNTCAAETNSSTPRYGTSLKDHGLAHLPVADRQWGQLFTEHGEPTRRLGSILRGLANYMIREYEPRCSIVIPPVKMFVLYMKYRLDKEYFPLQGVFDYQSRHCLRNLELLYQDLGCEYHLIQDNHYSTRPFIPALTPTGLQTWFTAFIQASPDQECHRLQMIIADMPLEADHQGHSSPERLPGRLSRHLLPSHRHDGAYKDIVYALDGWTKRMGSSTGTPEPSSPSSWSSILYEAFRGTSHVASNQISSRREKLYSSDSHKRYNDHGRSPLTGDVTISPANTARRRRKNPPHTSPHPHRDQDYTPSRESQYDVLETRYFPSSSSEPVSRRCSESSPESIRHGGRTSRHRDKSPKAQRAESIDSAGRAKRQSSQRYTAREFEDPEAGKRSPGPRQRAPDVSPARVDSYKFFQGRELGPTYDEFMRGKLKG